MLKRRFKELTPVLLLFVVLNALFITGRTVLERWNVDQDVLIIGNLLLFLITLVSFGIAQKGLKSTNPNAFLRSVYGSIMLKLFLCIIAAVVYIVAFRSELNKPALFTCMGLYLVYTFLEVTALLKRLKHKTHG